MMLSASSSPSPSVIFVLEQVTCGHEQDQAEDVEHPGEGVDDRCAGEDEGAARQDREDDTEEQDPSAWFSRATRKVPIIIMKTKRLSTERASSVM